MKRIPLTQGKFAIVDDEDYDFLMQWKWYAHRQADGIWYACRMRSRKKGKRTLIYMHREIAGPDQKKQVHHKDTDGLDNRKEQLQSVTSGLHHYTYKKRKNTLSRYKGVWYIKTGTRIKRWVARIRIQGKCLYLGYFHTETEAAQAYDKKLHELFGDFAQGNDA